MNSLLFLSLPEELGQLLLDLERDDLLLLRLPGHGGLLGRVGAIVRRQSAGVQSVRGMGLMRSIGPIGLAKPMNWSCPTP